jgi:hypothetical protein
MARTGDLGIFELPTPLRGGHKFVQGIVVTPDEQGLVLVTPVYDQAAAAYDFADGSGGTVRGQFIAVGLSDFVDVSACPADEVLKFNVPPSMQSVHRLYYTTVSGDSAVSAQSRASGLGMSASSSRRASPTSMPDPALIQVIERLAASLETQQGELRELKAGMDRRSRSTTASSAPRVRFQTPPRPDRTWETVMNGGEVEEDESDDAADEIPPGTGTSGSAGRRPTTRAGGGGDIQSLVELVRLLKTTSHDESDDSDANLRDSKTGKGLQGIQKLRLEVRDKPERVIKRYLKHVQQKLGVTDSRQVWGVRDYSKRLQSRFGRQRSFFRIHYMMSECIQTLAVEKNHATGTAMLIQLHKALHQSVLDNGSWEVAALMWPGHDPLAGDEFSGEPVEMESVYAYRKALSELRLKHKGVGAHAGDDEDEEAAPTGPYGGGRGGAHRKKKGDGRGKSKDGAGTAEG